MRERLLFSNQRKEEFRVKIEQELIKYKEEIEIQLEKQGKIKIDFFKRISEKILADEKLKIINIIEKQRRFEEKTFRVHPQDFRFYYFEYLIMIFADLGEEGIEFLNSNIKTIDEEIIEFNDEYDYTSKALTELYLQAYEIIKGILYLCKYGLGNNAMSLWRTLFEVTTIFLFIAENNNQSLSRKFLIHSIFKAEFNIKRREQNNELKLKIEKEFNNENFFKYDYEWADSVVKRNSRGQISFSTLYKNGKVKLNKWEDYYKEACSYTHSTVFRNAKRYDVSEVLIWSEYLMNKLYSSYGLYISNISGEKTRITIMIFSFNLLYKEMERYINENKK